MDKITDKYKTVDISEKDNISVRFLYNTVIGRALLKMLIRPSLSKFIGKIMNSAVSRMWISGFIKRNNIDMTQYENRKFRSFNDFFTRKILPGKRTFSKKTSLFSSPCDSKLTAYKIDANSVFNIKHSSYTINDLLQDEELAKEYVNGYCLIFRLTTDDYHRYAHIDDGKVLYTKTIKGVLHTVRPIAQSRYPVFAQNSREYTVIETENFGKIIQIEVGALLIGRISNRNDQFSIKRGSEKGMFEFGGSTIVVLLQEKEIVLDDEILENTLNDRETIVKMGQIIGRKITAKSVSK